MTWKLVLALVLGWIGQLAYSADLTVQSYPQSTLDNDADILHEALLDLHPGIYTYLTPAEFEKNFVALKVQLKRDHDLVSVYLDFARFLAMIRCGHTWINPLNQPDQIKSLLYQKTDRLPLKFDLVDHRFLVTVAAPDSGINAGDEVVSIDNESVAAVIQKLWLFLRADGGSDEKRYQQIGGQDNDGAFDLYYALLSPSPDGYRALVVKARSDQLERKVRVKLTDVTGQDKLKPANFSKDWSMSVENHVAIMTMPTWAFWNKPFDYKTWLSEAFHSLRQQQVQKLVIDLRRNEGGDEKIGDEILRYLAKKRFSYQRPVKTMVYDVVPARLRPYLSTWDPSFYDQSSLLQARAGREYALKNAQSEIIEIEPHPAAFPGAAVILTGPENSSATFLFAQKVKHSKVAILVGQATGGNLRGINGDKFFFLKLPGTGITIDIPLVASRPKNGAPDSPLYPDVEIQQDFMATAAGGDPALDAARKILTPDSKKPKILRNP